MIRFSAAHWPNTLADLELFSGCSPRELRRIGSLLTALDVDPGETLIHEGTTGLEFLVIAHGQAAVYVAGEQVAVLDAGGFTGEMALLDRAPRSATVRALTPLTFYVCNAAEFSTLLGVSPRVRDRIVAAAEQRATANKLAA